MPFQPMPPNMLQKVYLYITNTVGRLGRSKESSVFDFLKNSLKFVFISFFLQKVNYFEMFLFIYIL